MFLPWYDEYTVLAWKFKKKDFILRIVINSKIIFPSTLKTMKMKSNSVLVSSMCWFMSWQKKGADFAVFVNTAQEADGSDSGARPDEAITWGKIKINAKPVKVFLKNLWVWCSSGNISNVLLQLYKYDEQSKVYLDGYQSNPLYILKQSHRFKCMKMLHGFLCLQWKLLKTHNKYVNLNDSLKNCI